MTYRKKKYSKEYYEKLCGGKKKKSVKPFNCDEDKLLMLTGAIIRSALEDYCMIVPKVKKGMNKLEIASVEKKIYDNATAAQFFENSALFKASGVDLNYILWRFRNEQENS